MSEAVKFTVDEVRGCPRPKFDGRNRRTYMPAPYMRYKQRVAEAYVMAGGTLLDGPVDVSIDVRRHLPESRPKRVLNEPDTFTPDADNIAKGVLDALNGVAYRDDSCVVSLRVLKCDRERGATDHITVRVSPFD